MLRDVLGQLVNDVGCAGGVDRQVGQAGSDEGLPVTHRTMPASIGPPG